MNAKLARKKKRNKDIGPRRVLMMTTLSIVIVAVCLLGFKLWQFVKNSSMFLIADIRVEAKNYTKEEVLALSNLKKGMNYFEISPRKIEKKLESRPNIENASVKKEWNSVTIKIVERKPLAKIKNKGRCYCIDESGVVFKSDKAAKDLNVPEIKGIKSIETLVEGKKAKGTVINKALTVLRLYEYNKLRELATIHILEIYGQNDIILWMAAGHKVTRGAKIELGSTNYEQSLAQFAQILEGNQRRIASLDLTLSSPVLGYEK